MKPKVLREFEYRGYRVAIHGYYEDQPPWGQRFYYKENGEKKLRKGVVYLPYFIFKIEDGSLYEKLLLQDIKEWDGSAYKATHNERKVGKWYNRKKESIHIKEDLQNKLDRIEKKLRKNIDYQYKTDDIKKYFQEMTDGLPDSLDNL